MTCWRRGGPPRLAQLCRRAVGPGRRCLHRGATYAVFGAQIHFTGNGGDDFVGFGAALLTTDTANVTIDGVEGATTGVIRPALVADGAIIQAPSNKSVSMTVNGAATLIAPGSFKGSIALSVQ